MDALVVCAHAADSRTVEFYNVVHFWPLLAISPCPETNLSPSLSGINLPVFTTQSLLDLYYHDPDHRFQRFSQSAQLAVVLLVSVTDPRCDIHATNDKLNKTLNINKI